MQLRRNKNGTYTLSRVDAGGFEFTRRVRFNDFVLSRDAAEIAGKSEMTIHNWRVSGRLLTTPQFSSTTPRVRYLFRVYDIERAMKGK